MKRQYFVVFEYRDKNQDPEWQEFDKPWVVSADSLILNAYKNWKYLDFWVTVLPGKSSTEAVRSMSGLLMDLWYGAFDLDF